MRILFVNDSEQQIRRLLAPLRREGIRPDWRAAASGTDLRRALAEFSPDLLLCNYGLPDAGGTGTTAGPGGLDALAIARELRPGTPLIFVCGPIGEARAIQALHLGATDLVLESDPERLVPAIDRALRIAAARRKSETQHAVARVLAEAESAAGVVPRLLEAICASHDFVSGALWEVDTARQLLRCVDAWSTGTPELVEFSASMRGLAVPPGIGLAGRTWAGGKPSWVADCASEQFVLLASEGARANLHVTVAIPLVIAGNVLGVMVFAGTDVREEDEETLQAFVTVGSQIGQFLDREAQRRRIARLNRIYAVLSGINSVIVRVRSLEQLFQEACQIAVRAGGFRLAWAAVIDDTRQQLRLVANDGVEAALLPHIPMKLGAEATGLPAQALREQCAQVSNDLPNDARIVNKRQVNELGLHSLIVLPLISGGEPRGVLALYAGEKGFFDDEEEMRLLRELSGDIGFALGHIEQDQRLQFLSLYDELTGLPNRTLFLDRLTQAIAGAAQPGGKTAVIVGDIPRFRLINESLGRSGGDAVISELGRRLKAIWPASGNAGGNVARIAADCFAGLITDASGPRDIMRRVQRPLESMLALPMRVGERDLHIAFVAGIAVCPDDGATADELLSKAEAAQKNAKASGEPLLFYEPAMTDRFAETLLLENKLRRALEHDQFVLHYQPKINAMSGLATGFEALIRWNDPDTGLVPPGRFIPLLEAIGMILPVGAWAIGQALRDCRRWVNAGYADLRVAVNVSATQLQRPDFVEQVQRAVREHPDAAGLLDLEITESLIMQDIDANIERLSALRDMGVKIAVDDFGTGYSSLAYLARLPIHALKIDRTFVDSMVTSPESMTIVTTIIMLARSLGLKVIAEGVETTLQAQYLHQTRCDEFQGFLFSRPMPPEDVPAFLRANAAAPALG